MNTWPALLHTGATAGAVLLFAAGVGHLRHPQLLRAALAAQRVPGRWRRLAGALAPVELGTATLVLGTSLLVVGRGSGTPSTLLVVSTAAQTVLYSGFALHLGRVLRRTPGAPCGCFGAEPVHPATIGRAALFALCSFGCALAGPVTGGPLAAFAVLGAGVLIALIAAVAPALLALGRVSR